ncbi:MAG: hypothetical protein H8D37_05375 [Chloroflexi bacterium]|nr:hypothetical protein [Chloroflexota bacterium]
MKKYCAQFSLSLIVYCLMPNHYHYLVRQDGEGRVGLLPQRVFNSYSKAYNKRYGHRALFNDYISLTAWVPSSVVGRTCP